MQVGDLVKFKNNGAMGLIIAAKGSLYHIQWLDGVKNSRFGYELEVVSASR